MLTAIVSDLHLGTAAGVDVARRPRPLERLVEVAAEADRLVLLGDLLELRERPARTVLELADPVLKALGEATAGKQVVIVPGNHDHELVSPALDRARLANGGPLGLEGGFAPLPGELAAHVTACMPKSDVTISYPGVRLRDDVYALHGHYLDLHLTVPRMECVLASAVERFAGRNGSTGPVTADDYEASLTPIYAFAYAVAQSSSTRAVTRGGHLSRRVWRLANGNGDESRGRALAGTAVSRAAIPTAVAAINALGLGPFNATLSADELRRAGLRAIGEVVQRLGIDAEYVIFGHTHRAGPFGDDDAGWRLPDGTHLSNTGSWIHETVLLHGDGSANPYWPGRVTLLRDEGPPELIGALDEVELGTAV